MVRPIRQRASEVEEHLSQAENEEELEEAVHSLRKLIYAAKNQQQRVVFNPADSAVVTYSNYIISGKAPGIVEEQPTSVLQAHTRLVLSRAFAVDTGDKTYPYHERLYVGDAQFVVRAFAIAQALHGDSYLFVANNELAQRLSREITVEPLLA